MKKILWPVVALVAGLVLVILHFFGGNMEDSLKIEIQNAKVIMPAAYKVYANPDVLNGKYYLFKMLVTNEGNRPIDDVVVTFRIPKFIEWTEIGKIKRLNPGQSAVVSCYPSFNDNIVEKTTSSKEKAEIKITNKSFEKKEEFGFEMKGRNDFVYSSVPSSEIQSYQDMFDNNDLIPCFITPEDPIIKYYTQQVQEKILKGESASVGSDPKEAIRFLLGIYEATQRAHMVYSGTKGIPADFGDISSLVQHMRLPREVITGNTGLCIELSLLYASIIANEGLSPIIYLIPGHAYPGIRFNGQFYAIEATGIGGEGLGKISSASEAFQRGMKELDEFIKAARSGDQRYTIVDVNELIKQGVHPMELKDDLFMRQKVDELARNFNGGGGGYRPGGEELAQVGGTAQSMLSYSGNVSFSYPGGWARSNNPNPQLPYLITQFSAPGNGASIEVYEFPGANNPDMALYQLSQIFASAGVSLTYQKGGASRNGFQQYNGMSSSMAGTYQWTAFFKRTGSGVSGIAVGTGAASFAQMQGVFNNILSTVK